MTSSQRTDFYIPKWLEIQARTDWRMAGGRLQTDLDLQLRAAAGWPEHALTLVRSIISQARRLAAADARAVVADDLRKGCNLAASGGRTNSSRKFNRSDFNHFDRLRAVIADPWDMNALIAWQNPAEDDRKRTVVYLRKLANEGRLIAISLNAWAVKDWETLDQARLDALQAEIRKNAWSKFPRKRETQNEPY